MNWLSQLSFGSVNTNTLRKWWQERQPREQILMLVCLLVLIGYGSYSLYKLYQTEFVQMQMQLEEQQSDIIWLSEKQLELISLRQQGGDILDAGQIEEVILAAINSTNTDNSSTVKNTAEGWQVQWQGSAPSHFMKALTAMSQAGAQIQTLQLTRQNNNTLIQVTIN